MEDAKRAAICEGGGMMTGEISKPRTTNSQMMSRVAPKMTGQSQLRRVVLERVMLSCHP